MKLNDIFIKSKFFLQFYYNENNLKIFFLIAIIILENQLLFNQLLFNNFLVDG